MSVLDELLEALGVSAERGESAWRSADAEDIRGALITHCATHRLIDVDRWAETAPMCGEWCPAHQTGCSLVESPDMKFKDWCDAIEENAPTGKPCIWNRTP